MAVLELAAANNAPKVVQRGLFAPIHRVGDEVAIRVAGSQGLVPVEIVPERLEFPAAVGEHLLVSAEADTALEEAMGKACSIGVDGAEKQCRLPRERRTLCGLTRTARGGFPIHSEDIAATSARSCSLTSATSKLRAEAAMRVRAAPMAIGGVLSPFFARWKRTGLMRATT